MTTAQDQRKVELDFDGIKSNIINYYKTQTEFKDYNYTGANLQVLINNLAYNTHYMGLYASLSVNERFLDSAVSRSSVVSSAKMLGYVPHSRTSSKVYVNIDVSSYNNPPNSLTLPRLTNFTSLIPDVNGNTLSFVNLDSHVAIRSGSSFSFVGIPIHEGRVLRYQYTHTGELYSAYEIPNDNIDKSTIRVIVQNSMSDLTSTLYTKSDSIVDLDKDSKVFFVYENYRGKYEIRFGDNILGKSPVSGNVILIEYLVSAGSAADGLKNFVIDGIFSDGEVSVYVNTAYTNESSGGSDIESIESIKLNAPSYYSKQNRLITVEDFRSEIENISFIDSVSVWGGEDNNPPTYGKVFISVKPNNETVLSDSAKVDIINGVLKPKKVLSIVPVFVDPEYTYVSAKVTIKYNGIVSDKSPVEIEGLGKTAVSEYETDMIAKFNKPFYNESFINYISDIDFSVISTYAVINLQKRVIPFTGTVESFTLKMGAGIRPNSVSSTKFYMYIDGIQRLISFRDVPNQTPPSNGGDGTLQIWDSSTNTVYIPNAGSVNYYTGIISTNTLTVEDLPQGISTINFTTGMQETQYDIDVDKNTILLMDDSPTNVFTGQSIGVSVEAIKL